MKGKGLLSVILTLALLMCDFPVTASAIVYTPADGETLDISACASGDVIKIGAGRCVTLKGNSAPLTNVSITCGAGVNLTLQNVIIDNESYPYVCPLTFTGPGSKLILDSGTVSTLTSSDSAPGVSVNASAELELENNGTLTVRCTTRTLPAPGFLGCNAGLQCPSGATLTISGSGTLNATGYNGGAGIGGSRVSACGSITINSGTVIAKGGGLRASSQFCHGIDGGKITISGGTVNSADTSYGGIGGNSNEGSSISINGGTVTATSRSDAPGIGGFGSLGCDVTITGGTVTATNSKLAGIGRNNNSRSGTVVISGGTVIAQSGGHFGGIDCSFGASGTVTITGGTVTATGSYRGAGICGSGVDSSGSAAGTGAVTISGGTVTATGGTFDTYGYYGAGICGSAAGTGSVTISGGTVYTGGVKCDIGSGLTGTEETLSIKGTAKVFLQNNICTTPTTTTHTNSTYPIGTTEIYGVGISVPGTWTADFGAYLPLGTVSYDVNGGSGTAPSPVTRLIGTTAAAAQYEGFSRAGHAFNGWNTAASGGGHAYQPGDSLTFGNNSVTLYAQWIDVISTAGISGITAPVAGAVPQAVGSLTAGQSGYTVTKLSWQNNDGSPATLSTDGKFKAASTYKAVIELTAAEGCKFQAFTPTVDTGTAAAGTVNADTVGNRLTFTVVFEPTGVKTVTGITVTRQPDKMGYTEGTDATLSLRGMVVTETYNDGSTDTVTFTTGAAAGYASNPADGTVLTNAKHNNTRVTVTHIASGQTAQTGNLTVAPAPPVAHPGAPTLLSAVAGNGKVTVSWSAVPASVGYNVYSTTASGVYIIPSTTVAGAVYSCDAAGLTNGITYYFVVTAVGPGGESAYSNEASATPRTIPGAPANVTATAGDGQATVSFTPPVDNGGSAVTGYTVTSSPGNITAAGTGTTITVTGLSNGTTYTFTVTAANDAGTGPASTASNAVTPYKPSGEDPGGSNTPSTSTTFTVNTGIDILVNGQRETAATATITREGGRTVTTILVDDKKIEERLEQAGSNAVVTLPVKNGSDDIVGTLNGQTVKNMEAKEAVLEIKTEKVTYSLPAGEINIDDVFRQIGGQVELKDIKVSITIAEPSQDIANLVEDTANKNSYQVVVKPIEFNITCSSGDKTVEVSKFNGYVERTVAIPDGIDPNRITTGVVLNKDGSFSHVPTSIIVIDGKYYARINSLTNSTYSVIWSPKTFKDAENHWAKDAVNDMGSRLVISAVGNDMFGPDRDITRGEFSAIVVRALGLIRPGTGKATFSDVAKNETFYDAISIAYENGIISGYGNGKFGPMDKITREQGMTMIARAMKITGLKLELKDSEVSSLLANYLDGTAASDYAKTSIAACLKAGIIAGRSRNIIAPANYITRAEAAVIVQRLLQKSGLI